MDQSIDSSTSIKEKKSAQFTRYNPKRWHPEFDLMVIESINGRSNAEIGKIFGYTKEHVSNILSTPQAAETKERIRETINKQFEGQLKDKIGEIGAKAIQRIGEFIENDTYAAARPFDFVDRALKIAQATQSLAADNGKGNLTINQTNVAGNAIVVNGEQASGLKKALMASMELDQIEVGSSVEITDVVSPNERLIRVG